MLPVDSVCSQYAHLCINLYIEWTDVTIDMLDYPNGVKKYGAESYEQNKKCKM